MHTLFEQDISPNSASNYSNELNNLLSTFGLNVKASSGVIEFYLNLNDTSGTHFRVTSGLGLYVYSKTKEFNRVEYSFMPLTIFHHTSTGETVNYLSIKPDDTSKNIYTYIIAEDENGEKVFFNADNMYSNYGATGIYKSLWKSSDSAIVSDDNLFIISKAARTDTGVPFKELYGVLSAKTFSDRNQLVVFKNRIFRIVSVSNSPDASGRYPAFAFPVSDE